MAVSFVLPRHLVGWISPGGDVNRSSIPVIVSELSAWLSEHDIQYSFSLIPSGRGIIIIEDEKAAMLFKLRWL